jgi:prophage antirepressor-like protein
MSEAPARSNSDPLPVTEPYFSVADVARALGLSRYTVARRFANFPGVIDAGQQSKNRSRRYRVLRIPKSALHKFLRARSVA